MNAFEFILWALMTVLDVGGPLLVAESSTALSYLKARSRLWLTKK